VVTCPAIRSASASTQVGSTPPSTGDRRHVPAPRGRREHRRDDRSHLRDEASLAQRRRELTPALPIEDAKFNFLTTEQAIERMRPFAELAGNDFLLAAYAPYDWESLELFVRDVAPALRA